MEGQDFHTVYFIGIGGIGMSNLARYFHQRGAKVSGYDKTPSPLTRKLEQEGMPVYYKEDIAHIPQDIKNKKAGTLVVYTPAIPKEHQELVFLKSAGVELFKRSEVLGLLSRNLYTIGVAGTHGKTSTSTMLAHLLHHGGKDTAAFLGGISVNFDSNLLVNASSNALCVVEADEFDRSFHRLSPRDAIITSAGADHLDIYGTHEALLQAFREYIDKLPAGGHLIIQEGIANLADHRTDISIITYGIDSGMAQAQDIRADQGAFLFNYKSEDCFIQDLKLYVPGFHNVENMVAAITIARGHGLSDAAIKKAVADFQGVKRRFEYIVKQEDRIYIDDYAHHPEEIEACLKSVRALFPDKKLSIAFQPHLFSRTQDFMEDFGKALGLADEVFLLDIYPARELPIPGVSAEVLLEKISAKSKTLLSKEGLLERIKQDLPHLFLTLGAGDIDRLIPEIKAILQAEQAN